MCNLKQQKGGVWYGRMRFRFFKEEKDHHRLKEKEVVSLSGLF